MCNPRKGLSRVKQGYVEIRPTIPQLKILASLMFTCTIIVTERKWLGSHVTSPILPKQRIYGVNTLNSLAGSALNRVSTYKTGGIIMLHKR